MLPIPPCIPRIRRLAIAVTALFPAVLAACGGSDGTAPTPDPIEITVSGVQDGMVAEGPVTIRIEVSRGTYDATLNGETFFSGTTVSDPGSYSLRVDARDGADTATETIDFEIRLGGESVLVVRLFDLGPNEAGGGGDAILLTDSADAAVRHAVIDAGPEGIGGRNEGFVQGRLEDLDVGRLDFLLLTHAHTDHFLGMRDVLEGTEVGTFFYNGQVRSFSSYDVLLSTADARADEVVVPTDPTPVTLGAGDAPTRLTVLPPLGANLSDTDDGSDLNDESLGAHLRKGAFTMFFTGDGEVDANARWRRDFGDLTGGVTALKVGHHGANDAVFDNGSSGSSAWLTHTDPELQVISANGETHPRIRALGALLDRSNTRTYCTNVHGDIEIRVDPSGAWSVTVERNGNADCVAGSGATS